MRTLWESGVPLDYAWVEFARFFDNFAWFALQRHPINDNEIASHPRYQELNKGWLPRTWEGRQRKFKITMENERVALLVEIYAGRLWAIGFRTLPSGSDEPVRVPREFFCLDPEEAPFHDGISWAKGQLMMNDESYFDIRVVHSPGQEDQRVRSMDETKTPDETREDFRAITSPVIDEVEVHKPGSSGRPSKGDVILAAIAEHSNNDPGLTLPKRERFRAYRSYISEQGHDSREDGFSEKTIEKFETKYRKKKR